MEEEMEVEPVFEVREIDLDYEFEVARWFDFTREESPAEAHEAELWFESAKSYPPSPFVAKLFLGENVSLNNVNTSPKPKDGEDTTTLLNDAIDYGLGSELTAADVNSRDYGMYRGIFANLPSGNPQFALNQPVQSTSGLTFNSHISGDKLKGKPRTTVKPFLPRSSTLMKPTASQLAKQNHSRLQALQADNNEKSLCNSSMVESQAAKRQKLEGGLLHKVADVKQQTSLVHKAPKKDGTVDRSLTLARMRLTVPREPELETAHRAQRIRPKNSAEVCVPSTAHKFKARPLNRKILEGPSLPLPQKSTPRLPEFQEFRLKTSVRAMQHLYAVSSSSLQCNHSNKVSEKASNTFIAVNGNRETIRPSDIDAAKHDGCDAKYHFKARPLNKKILTSKGEIGMFRNSKRETTVPMEFKFHMQQRVQQNPPTELFSKLSLSSELQPNNGSQWKFPQPTFISAKGSKENRSNSLLAGHEITQMMKEKPTTFGGNDGCIFRAGTQCTAGRSMGIC